jgi:anti-sigma regulatory factor (Ser/Thr protein kinase)
VTEAPTEVVRARFPGQPGSVRAARHLLRSHVAPMLPDEHVDTAVLLVSELVTNTVVHAGTSVELVVCIQDRAGLRVEVADGSVQHPTIRHDPMASTGRGLHLLDALADRWGVTARATGKTVWFELSGDENWTEESVMKSSLKPAKFSGMVWIDGVQAPVNLDAGSWDEAIAALNNQYGHDSAFVLRTEDAAMQPG